MSENQIPVGTYMARGVAGSEQYGETKSNAPQIGIDMQLIGGEVEGAIMTMFLSFSGNAPKYSIQKLRQMGWQGDDLEDLKGIDANEVQVRVFDDTYQGKTTRKIEVNWSGGGQVKLQSTMDPKQKRGFAASFANVVRENPAQARGKGDDFPGSYGGGSSPKY